MHGALVRQVVDMVQIVLILPQILGQPLVLFLVVAVVVGAGGPLLAEGEVELVATPLAR